MIKNITIYVIILFLLAKCGFTPIYFERSDLIQNNYRAILVSDNSKIVEETFNSIFRNLDKRTDYELKVNIEEKDLPIITNTDGTIAKYRIDISVSFILYDIENNQKILSDYSKGFAQYETQTNNYGTKLKRTEAKKIATTKAVQLIPIKIQNFQSRKVE